MNERKMIPQNKSTILRREFCSISNNQMPLSLPCPYRKRAFIYQHIIKIY